MLSDPIADLLTRIRNALKARHRYVDFEASKLKLNFLKVLEAQGFVEKVIINDRKARLFLKYSERREPVIRGLKRVSAPGLRRYIGYRDLPKILGGMGIAILSTPQGVVDGEKARELKVGGELMCYIW